MAQTHKFPRHLVTELKEALATSRIVNLTGPRQVGKTTLARDLLKTGEYITLDEEGVLEAINRDAAGQLESLRSAAGEGPLIIDEAQRSSELAMAVKMLVDRDTRKGQFLLTGSSNLFTTAAVADSLPGQMRTLRLWPMTVSETRELNASLLLDWATQEAPSLDQIRVLEGPSRRDYIELLLEGGFPEPRTFAIRPRQRLYRDYVDSVVDRDVAEILRIRKTDRLRRLIEQMTARTGAKVNVSKLGEVVGVNRATLDTHLDILTRLSLVIRLGSWTSGESRREIKNAKYHFVDTGMACALRHFNDRSFTAGQPNATALGGLLESFVLGELTRVQPMQERECRLYHWRNADGREIDILAESPDTIVGFEVKASTAVSGMDFRHLKWFSAEGPGRSRKFCGIVLYLGQHKLSFGEGCFALPISSLWAQIELQGSAAGCRQPVIPQESWAPEKIKVSAVRHVQSHLYRH